MDKPCCLTILLFSCRPLFEQFQRWGHFTSWQNPLPPLACVHGCQASHCTGQPQTNAPSWGVFKADATSCRPSALSFHRLPMGSYHRCLALASSYCISSHNPLHRLHCSLTGLYAVHLCTGCPLSGRHFPSVST